MLLKDSSPPGGHGENPPCARRQEAHTLGLASLGYPARQASGRGPQPSHLMDQVRDLVLPPLLACWLLTFLLQGKKTQSLSHREKSISHAQVGPKGWGLETNHTAQILGNKSQLVAVFTSVYLQNSYFY